MKSAHLLEQIAQLEGQKQNISNEAAFKVGQALLPLDTKIAELRAQIIRDNTDLPSKVVGETPVVEAAPVKKRMGRPKGSKNTPKATPVEEAQAS